MQKFDLNHIATFLHGQSIELADQHFLVALSGGLDSIVLAQAFSLLAEKQDCQVTLVHVNHNLRPDSKVDSDFCKAFAVRAGLPLQVVDLEPDYEPGASIEAWARGARYSALSKVCKELDADWIVTGHQLDDQAETILMRLKQGASLLSLAGIRPRRGNILRPLLQFKRVELTEWAVEQGLTWVEDPTNRDTSFLRNDLRHGILSDLRQQNPDLISQLARVADLGRQYEAWLTTAAAEFIEQAQPGSLPGTVSRSRATFLALESDASKLGLFQAMSTHLGISPSISAKQWHSFRHFVRVGKTGKIFDLSRGVKVLLDRKRLIAFLDKVAATPEQQLMVQGKLNWWGHRFNVRQLQTEPVVPLGIRSWQARDRVVAGNRGQHKLVSDIFIDAKLNHLDKLHWPVITNKQSIAVWVPGLTRPKNLARIHGWEVSWQR